MLMEGGGGRVGELLVWGGGGYMSAKRGNVKGGAIRGEEGEGACRRRRCKDLLLMLLLLLLPPPPP
jgi:hypothetical protein